LEQAPLDNDAIFLGDDLVVFGGQDENFNTVSSVEYLLTRRNLYEHRLQEIGAAELIRDDRLPVGVWPHVSARIIKKEWYSHVFYFLKEKNGEIFQQH
jgi:hypothetical protein